MPGTQPAGARFRAALDGERPLQIAGTINAYCALLAERAGFRAIYLSGGGIANASFGLPDLGVTTLDDVAEDVRRITDACPLPLLVDADTGFGPALVLARTVRRLAKAGAAGIHIEDQVQAKRCGHRPGKELVSSGEMQDRLKAATDARDDASFVIMARTDSYAAEGLAQAVERANDYVDAGADMIFAEALTTLNEFRAFTSRLSVPVLANITEFGKTPLFGRDELGAQGGPVIRELRRQRELGRALDSDRESQYRLQVGSVDRTAPPLDEPGMLLDELRNRAWKLFPFPLPERLLERFSQLADEFGLDGVLENDETVTLELGQGLFQIAPFDHPRPPKQAPTAYSSATA